MVDMAAASGRQRPPPLPDASPERRCTLRSRKAHTLPRECSAHGDFPYHLTQAVILLPAAIFVRLPAFDHELSELQLKPPAFHAFNSHGVQPDDGYIDCRPLCWHFGRSLLTCRAGRSAFLRQRTPAPISGSAQRQMLPYLFAERFGFLAGEMAMAKDDQQLLKATICRLMSTAPRVPSDAQRTLYLFEAAHRAFRKSTPIFGPMR